MNVIVFASRKGGSGKSTLTAHIAAQAQKSSRPCLLIDADPQGSLTLWHGLRGTGEPVLRSAQRGVSDILKAAKRDYDWVFIDTPPTISALVNDAIRSATLVVIPTRPTVFDLNAVRETIDLCRGARKPYAVVINAAPVKRDDQEPKRARASPSCAFRCGADRSPTGPISRSRSPPAKGPRNTMPTRRPPPRSRACGRRSTSR